MNPAPDLDRCPFGPEYQDAWDMRRALFSRFDEGVRLDAVALFGAKPEDAALVSAERLPGRRVLDGFCGSGGSAIALARSGKQVVSADLDPARLAMAQHNARLYGVDDRIRFVEGDVFDLVRQVDVDAVYFDPPWGSLDAWQRPRFGLGDFTPPVAPLIALAFERVSHVLLSVPPNFDHGEFAPWRRLSVHPVRLQGEVLYVDVLLAPGGADASAAPSSP